MKSPTITVHSHFFMNMRSLVSASLIASVSLSVIPSAIARESSPTAGMSMNEILQEQQTIETSDLCKGTTGSLHGKCIGDVIKRIHRLRHDWSQAIARERKEWQDAHASMGVSPEYMTALKAYTDEVAAKRKLFNEQQRVIEKQFFSQQTIVRRGAAASSSSSSSARPSVSTTQEQALRDACKNQKDPGALRVCLRIQLRKQDPNVRQKGAVEMRLKGE